MRRAHLTAAGLVLALGGCADPGRRDVDERGVPEPAPASPTRSPADRFPAPSVGAAPTLEPLASDGTPRRARLSVPSLGVRDVLVVPYAGWTDDAPGTRIQNRGPAASPHGPRGGTGPGGIGNYQVTGHRTSAARPFEHLPRLRRGDVVRVDAGGVRYVYEIVATRQTSFRSPASLARQRAAVPGRPGVEPTRAMITLSTCATREDHAAGNFWTDRYDNPEHRIDKVGVLVRVR
ncbi:sortase [Nocardioides guangzhouensis]|uniref:Sortase n=1 Tax=Nocardioides guangzhouensis TaxID=2497878 RepID=A0A4Q4ZHV2_9ACTN|nr:sortase [Nocardioides guangzhouensis]RYP87081.1 sortase [Nocardioides guangzhouensis]